jgi:hypothetical protein
MSYAMFGLTDAIEGGARCPQRASGKGKAQKRVGTTLSTSSAANLSGDRFFAA